MSWDCCNVKAKKASHPSCVSWCKLWKFFVMSSSSSTNPHKLRKWVIQRHKQWTKPTTSIINGNNNSTTTSESEVCTHTHVVSLTYARLDLTYVDGLLKNNIHYSTHVTVCPSVAQQSPMENTNELFTTRYSTPSGKKERISRDTHYFFSSSHSLIQATFGNALAVSMQCQGNEFVLH